MTGNIEPAFRFSKLLREAIYADTFSPGAPLRFVRALDGESLVGRHEGKAGGRARKIAGGAPKASLSAMLAAHTGPASRFGAAQGGRRASFDRRQRAVVKLHYFGHGGGGAGALRAHARYVARDAAGRDVSPGLTLDQDENRSREDLSPGRGDGREGLFYDAVDHSVDGAARVAEWSREDRRHFRLILSAENGARLADLKDFTREVMTRAEAALGTRLDWVAIDHWDTDNPHTHIILRGRTQDGRDLIIPRDYVSHGFRNAARDIATEQLGLRGRDDERLALAREALAHRPTRLDPIIAQQLDENRRIRLARLQGLDPDHTNALKARAQELKRLGLAREIARNLFEFKPDWERDLVRLELHLDIRKNLMREQAQALAHAAELNLAKSLGLGPDR